MKLVDINKKKLKEIEEQRDHLMKRLLESKAAIVIVELEDKHYYMSFNMDGATINWHLSEYINILHNDATYEDEGTDPSDPDDGERVVN